MAPPTTRRFWTASLSALIMTSACLLPGTASAQEAAADGRTVYPAEFFTGFAPSSALDIVARIPGFSLQDSDQEVRGFGQAAGNLVINGSRPSAKSDSLSTILSRIPASRVLRVEVGSGDLFGSEFSGKPQVVNLVLVEGGGLAGTATASTRIDHSGRVTPQASVSALMRRGPSTFNASIGYDNFQQIEEGSDTIRAFPSGNLIEFRRKVNDIQEQQAYITGSWALAGDETHGAHINGRLARGWFDLGQTNDVFPTGGTIRDDRLSQANRRTNFELGGDVTRPLAGGGIKLVGLMTRLHVTNQDNVFNRVQSQVIGGFAQALDAQRDETVLRTVWSHRNIGGWSVEAGVEGALNRLDSNVLFEEINGMGVRTRIDLPVDQAVVTERRGEAFVTAGRALTPKLRIDLGMTYEASRLTVTGDTQSERSLSFWKPKLSLDWRPADAWHLQFSAARTVAQLDFEEFISVAELTNDRVNGGNVELLPQRAWELQATVERTFWTDGSIKLEGLYHRISLLQDRVPTPEGFDAPGNLGNGELMFVRGAIDVPLSRLGIRGGRLKMNGELKHTSVTDPYTGQSRRFSGYASWDANIEFRQDLGAFAWGVSLYGQPARTIYRRNEEDHNNGIEPYLVGFVEWRPDRRTTLTLNIDNMADVRATRTRTFYAPDRSTATPNAIEFRERNNHVAAMLTLKYNFD